MPALKQLQHSGLFVRFLENVNHIIIAVRDVDLGMRNGEVVLISNQILIKDALIKVRLPSIYHKKQ